ncbi:transposase [Selenomonas bovis]|uniref:transposase n=1 Tax=Selenomonas bovis TaxID=416586 RepID=UPI003AB9B511
MDSHSILKEKLRPSNAVLEATNRKIKRSVSMAYGFCNIDNMIDMMMLRCSDIDVRLPWDYEAA